jgi:hypothetical protein
MNNKSYKVKTVKENEVYTITAFDNGDEIIHVNVNENEMVSLSENYEVNGFIRMEAV